MCRSKLVFIIGLVLIIGLSSSWDHPALGQATVEQSRLNPAFVAYMEQVLSGWIPRQQSESGEWLGYVPSPVDLSHTVGRCSDGFPKYGVPASYDLRGTGRLSSIRNQGSCGSCWTFGTYGAHESWKLSETPADAQDFSENHLKECHLFDWGPCAGGNRDISSAYLARGDGTVLEGDDPYIAGADPAGCSQSILACPAPEGPPLRGSVAQPVVYEYVRNVYWISDVDKVSDPAPDYLKQAIMTYGAVMTTMQWENSCYDSSNYTYYYSGAGSGNHCVALVGWDDLMAVTGAPSPGAWIVRNSWGPGPWSVGPCDGGYFYISYYDTVIATENTVFINTQNPGGLWIYDYDPYGYMGAYYWVNDNVDWGANVFTAETSGRLLSVGFYTNDVNTAYELDVRQGTPWGTSLLASNPSGTCPWPGYHVVDLPTPLSVTFGDVFAVVVKFENPTYKYALPVEYRYVGYNTAASASPGQSYVSYDGSHTQSHWDDLTTWESTTNVCIKVIFTDEPTSAVFRVTEIGRVRADGSFYGAGFYTGSADVAEWVSVSEPVEPGDVLELDPSNPGFYRKSQTACSSLVAGVVSTQPGFVLGAKGQGSATGVSSVTDDSRLLTPDKALLALIGIVPIKVTNEGGPIKPGDLLVSSSTPGYAMRRDPQSGEACGLIGKALEPLTEETGIILVLLTAH